MIKRISHQEFDDLLTKLIHKQNALLADYSIDNINGALHVVYKLNGKRTEDVVNVSDIPSDYHEKLRLFNRIGSEFAEKMGDIEIEAVFWASIAWVKTAQKYYFIRSTHAPDRKESFSISGMTPDYRTNGAVAFLHRDNDETVFLGDFKVTVSADSSFFSHIIKSFYDGYFNP